MRLAQGAADPFHFAGVEFEAVGKEDSALVTISGFTAPMTVPSLGATLAM
jgi:hypothetical protein